MSVGRLVYPSVSNTLNFFFGVHWRFFHRCSGKNVWLAFLIIAPAHQQATWVAVYPALFFSKQYPVTWNREKKTQLGGLNQQTDTISLSLKTGLIVMKHFLSNASSLLPPLSSYPFWPSNNKTTLVGREWIFYTKKKDYKTIFSVSYDKLKSNMLLSCKQNHVM